MATGHLTIGKAAVMKTMRIAAAATGLVLALTSLTALADEPRASSQNATFQTIEGQPANVQAVTPHREWRYHYVGHHPRFEGYWEQVR